MTAGEDPHKGQEIGNSENGQPGREVRRRGPEAQLGTLTGRRGRALGKATCLG